ncbi:hypothetical protein Bbelb_320790 [Branchiostoma belcheri]|nr:hypothetical protein Bbelb_320790 [Branchiostoma belcheri]
MGKKGRPGRPPGGTNSARAGGQRRAERAGCYFFSPPRYHIQPTKMCRDHVTSSCERAPYGQLVPYNRVKQKHLPVSRDSVTRCTVPWWRSDLEGWRERIVFSWSKPSPCTVSNTYSVHPSVHHHFLS